MSARKLSNIDLRLNELRKSLDVMPKRDASNETTSGATISNEFSQHGPDVVTFHKPDYIPTPGSVNENHTKNFMKLPDPSEHHRSKYGNSPNNHYNPHNIQNHQTVQDAGNAKPNHEEYGTQNIPSAINQPSQISLYTRLRNSTHILKSPILVSFFTFLVIFCVLMIYKPGYLGSDVVADGGKTVRRANVKGCLVVAGICASVVLTVPYFMKWRSAQFAT